MSEASEWRSKLAEHLLRADVSYMATAQDDLRYQATANLLDLISHLRGVPELEGQIPFTWLKDIASALWDLETGKRHPWSYPRSFGGTSALGTAKQELKKRTVIAAEVMIAAGFGANEAYRHLAQLLGKSGRSGREDVAGERHGTFAHSTIKRWHNECRSEDKDAAGYRFVTKELEAYKADPRWPPSRTESIAFAERTLCNPLLRDRFVS